MGAGKPTFLNWKLGTQNPQKRFLGVGGQGVWMYILWKNTLQNNRKLVCKVNFIYMACGLQFCNLHLFLDNQLFNEKELLIIFHKINLKVNNLCYNCLKILETCIYSPPRTKELLCPVLEKGRWIAKHSLKTLFQAAKQKIEKKSKWSGSCVMRWCCFFDLLFFMLRCN